MRVAPEMAEPVLPLVSALFHTYVKVTPSLGTQPVVVAVSGCPTVAVPEIVGLGAVAKVAEATAAVARLVLLDVVNPVFVPVTVTVMNLPRSAATSLYLSEFVPTRIPAPPMVSARFHSYLNVTSEFGTHPDAVAVRDRSTTAVPRMVGVGDVAKVAETTAGVAALVLLTVVNPDFVPTTVTVMVLPMSAAVSV